MRMPEEIIQELNAGSTVADLLRILVKQYPGISSEIYSEKGFLHPRVNILKNGRNIQHLAGLKTIIGTGDLIAIFPPAAGG